ncbi:nestin [Camelus bactrianus]|uniref:Nestin n=1 Tax=Camelus bactrianus TaxID=9837 RepID=A0A9W3GS75_CAMBA
MEGCLGEESFQMWELNRRLEAYLARVKALEEQNELLSAELGGLRAQSGDASWRARADDELAALRALVDQRWREKHAAEVARDNLAEEVESVAGRCQQLRLARERTTEEVAHSRRAVEAEKCAQAWLNTQAAELERELEALRAAHEEERAGLNAQAACAPRGPAPPRGPPAPAPEVEELARRLGEAWRGAVRGYQERVAQMEASLGQARERLGRAVQGAREGRLELQQLQAERGGLQERRAALEQRLESRWQERLRATEKFQLAVEALEQEKQGLQSQIAQVLEGRQQLAHLKMSLSLEVATYRTLLEAENSRLQTPGSTSKVPLSYLDPKLELHVPGTPEGRRLGPLLSVLSPTPLSSPLPDTLETPVPAFLKSQEFLQTRTPTSASTPIPPTPQAPCPATDAEIRAHDAPLSLLQPRAGRQQASEAMWAEAKVAIPASVLPGPEEPGGRQQEASPGQSPEDHVSLAPALSSDHPSLEAKDGELGGSRESSRFQEESEGQIWELTEKETAVEVKVVSSLQQETWQEEGNLDMKEIQDSQGPLEKETLKSLEEEIQDPLRSLEKQSHETVRSLEKEKRESLRSLEEENLETLKTPERENQELLKSLEEKDMEVARPLEKETLELLKPIGKEDLQTWQSLEKENQEIMRSLEGNIETFVYLGKENQELVKSLEEENFESLRALEKESQEPLRSQEVENQETLRPLAKDNQEPLRSLEEEDQGTSRPLGKENRKSLRSPEDETRETLRPLEKENQESLRFLEDNQETMRPLERESQEPLRSPEKENQESLISLEEDQETMRPPEKENQEPLRSLEEDDQETMRPPEKENQEPLRSLEEDDQETMRPPEKENQEPLRSLEEDNQETMRPPEKENQEPLRSLEEDDQETMRPPEKENQEPLRSLEEDNQETMRPPEKENQEPLRSLEEGDQETMRPPEKENQEPLRSLEEGDQETMRPPEKENQEPLRSLEEGDQETMRPPEKENQEPLRSLEEGDQETMRPPEKENQEPLRSLEEGDQETMRPPEKENQEPLRSLEEDDQETMRPPEKENQEPLRSLEEDDQETMRPPEKENQEPLRSLEDENQETLRSLEKETQQPLKSLEDRMTLRPLEEVKSEPLRSLGKDQEIVISLGKETQELISSLNGESVEAVRSLETKSQEPLKSTGEEDLEILKPLETESQGPLGSVEGKQETLRPLEKLTEESLRSLGEQNLENLRSPEEVDKESQRSLGEDEDVENGENQESLRSLEEEGQELPLSAHQQKWEDVLGRDQELNQEVSPGRARVDNENEAELDQKEQDSFAGKGEAVEQGQLQLTAAGEDWSTGEGQPGSPEPKEQRVPAEGAGGEESTEGLQDPERQPEQLGALGLQAPWDMSEVTEPVLEDEDVAPRQGRAFPEVTLGLETAVGESAGAEQEPEPEMVGLEDRGGLAREEVMGPSLGEEGLEAERVQDLEGPRKELKEAAALEPELSTLPRKNRDPLETPRGWEESEPEAPGEAGEMFPAETLCHDGSDTPQPRPLGTEGAKEDEKPVPGPPSPRPTESCSPVPIPEDAPGPQSLTEGSQEGSWGLEGRAEVLGKVEGEQEDLGSGGIPEGLQEEEESREESEADELGETLPDSTPLGLYLSSPASPKWEPAGEQRPSPQGETKKEGWGSAVLASEGLGAQPSEEEEGDEEEEERGHESDLSEEFEDLGTEASLLPGAPGEVAEPLGQVPQLLLEPAAWDRDGESDGFADEEESGEEGEEEEEGREPGAGRWEPGPSVGSLPALSGPQKGNLLGSETVDVSVPWDDGLRGAASDAPMTAQETESQDSTEHSGSEEESDAALLEREDHVSGPLETLSGVEDTGLEVEDTFGVNGQGPSLKEELEHVNGGVVNGLEQSEGVGQGKPGDPKGDPEGDRGSPLEEEEGGALKTPWAGGPLHVGAGQFLKFTQREGDGDSWSSGED